MPDWTYNNLVKLSCLQQIYHAAGGYFLFFGGFPHNDLEATKTGQWFNDAHDEACFEMAATISVWLNL
jgi:hypothetical protein